LNTANVSLELELLGKRIADLRGRRSQRELAKNAGVDISTISRIERALADPSYSTLRAIAKALGMTVTALIEVLPGNAQPTRAVTLDELALARQPDSKTHDRRRSLEEQIDALREELADTNDRVARLAALPAAAPEVVKTRRGTKR